MRAIAIMAANLALIGLTAAVRGDDWPQFRGTGAGVASDKTIPTDWGTDKNIQWKVKIPGVAWSSPVVTGDKIFVTTAVTDNQKKPAAGGGFGGGMGGGFPGGGFGGPPRMGQLLMPFLQDRLGLTEEQKKKVDDLQKETDGKLDKILTEDQRKQFREPAQGPGRGFGGFPQPGQVMSSGSQESLKLSDEQKKQVDELQKDVDTKLAKILTEEQSKQLKDMRQGFGRPGGPGGGFGGPGRPGGPGGGPGGFGGGRPPDDVYRWHVLCLDRASGKVLWDQVALEGKPRTAIQQSNTYATETPVTDGDRVYAYFGMHGLFCYDASGKQVWKKDLGVYQTQFGFGPASSPVLDGERLFILCDNEEKSFLVALNKMTGDELWRTPRTERTTWATPMVWRNKVRTEIVCLGSPKMRSYDPATGKQLWELTVGNGQVAPSPVGDSEMLYAGVGPRGGMGGGMMGGGAFGPPGGGRPGGGQPGRPGGPGGGGPPGVGSGPGGGAIFAVRAGAEGDITLKEGDTSNAGVAWMQAKGGPEMASPLVHQGHVYCLAQNGGILTCFDAKTGKQAYRERLPGAKSFWASPWAVNDKVFCLDDDGTTFVLQAGPTFKLLGKNVLGEMFWASPAVAGGAVFLRSVEHLYCIK